jgi:uncharacterized membrane protein (UPF0127 family)
MRRLPLLIPPLITCLTGCNSPSAAPSGLPTTTLQVGSKSYEVEIAANDASREHGLMERDNLPANHGMIFIFPDCKPRGFWMYHTRFPLDIVFADASAVVVSTHTMKPYDETNTPSDGPAKYAIELLAGQLESNGIKAGDRLSLPAAIAQTRAE